jgi:hypothetical protein
MGKKDKNKKSGKGAEKTALKTQKKLKNKLLKLTGEVILYFQIFIMFITRLTRLGEFLPNGLSFTFGSFINNTEISQNFGILFS